MRGERAATLEVLPTQVREVGQRSGECPGRVRLNNPQMGAWCYTEARQLIRGDAPVGGDDQLATAPSLAVFMTSTLLHDL